MPLGALETLRDAETAGVSRAPVAASPSDAARPELPPAETVPPETVSPADTAPRDVPPETVPPAGGGASVASSARPSRQGGLGPAGRGTIRKPPVTRPGIPGPPAAEVARPPATETGGPNGAAPGTRKQRTVGLAVALLAIALVGVGVVIFSGRLDGTVPADGRLLTTTSPGIAIASVTAANPSAVANATDTPTGSPAAGAASVVPTATAAVPTATAEPLENVALRTDTLVAQAWSDSAGTVRVHIVVSVTNDTSEVRSLAASERTFRLISAAGRTVHTGRFAYAFPFVVPPRGVSHLITTAVLPAGAEGTNLRVEAEILGDITAGVEPVLEVSGLRLVSSEGRTGVSGTVRNARTEDVSFGVVAILGRDASGGVIGGVYDNVNVASIPAGGEQVFQTEYPGLPPDAAGRIADLTAIAFDARASLLSPTSLASPTLTPSPTITAPVATPHMGTTEGCSPAFWATPSSFDLWEEHRPGDVLRVFFPEPVRYAQLTFREALEAPPVEDVPRMLIREATAAILNAAHDSLEYPFARYDVGIDGRPPIVPTVAELLRTGTTQEMEAFASQLAVANQLGCPLR